MTIDEPLGGVIPDGDPFIEDEGFDPRPLRDFSFAGDVNAPEFGCTWDGMPFSCSLLGVVLHGQSSFRLDINTRYEGGWEAYNGLSGMVSTWRYRVGLVVDNEDKNIPTDIHNRPDLWGKTSDGRHYLILGEFYVQYLSSAAETVVASFLQTRQSESITTKYMDKKYVKDFRKAHDEAKKRLAEEDCQKLFGKSAEELTKMLDNTEYRVLTLVSGGPTYDPATGAISVVGA